LFPDDLLGPPRQVGLRALEAADVGLPHLVSRDVGRGLGVPDELKAHPVAGPCADAVTVQPLDQLPVDLELLCRAAHSKPPVRWMRSISLASHSSPTQSMPMYMSERSASV